MLSGPKGWIKRLAANPLTWYILFAGLVLLIVVRHLGTQPAGLSPAEFSAKNHSLNLEAILKKPINAPHNLLAYGFHSAHLGWRTSLRLSSAVFGAALIYCFYLIVRAWFSGPIGVMGTILLATTPLFLVSARQGSAEIMLFGTSALLAIYLWCGRRDQKDLPFLVLAVAATLAIYTPGLIWWLAGTLIICRRRLLAFIEDVSVSTLLLACLLSAIIIMPLVIALVKDWTIINQLVLIPAHLETVILTLKHLAWMTLAIFIRAPYHNNLILGRLPVLSLLQVALLAFGIYALWSAAKAKLFSLFGTVVFAIVAAGFNNDMALLALGVPALAIIVCAGLRYLFIEWRGVFPLNPLAKSLALSLMWVIVIVQLLFGFRYAVIAWPNTVDTKSIYVLK